MIYTLLLIMYVQSNLDVRIQSIEAAGMFPVQADCETAAVKKRTAFVIARQGNAPAWRDAQCVPVPNILPQAQIAEGLDGL